MRGHDGAADIHRSQTRSQVLRTHQGSCRDAEPHRGSEGVLRPVPDGRGAPGRPAGRGTAGGVPLGVPDLGFLGHLDAGIRPLRIRAAEIRRRRVPPARHDLCCAAEGDAAPDRVRYRRGNRRQVGQGHQGAGRLHGRYPAHDHERHLRRQRHRARHRLADAPFARRVLRPRQGQDPFVRQAVVCRARDSVSRFLARHRVRRQGHRVRAHRPPPQDSRDLADVRARSRRRDDPVHLLQEDQFQARPRKAGACRSTPPVSAATRPSTT